MRSFFNGVSDSCEAELGPGQLRSGHGLPPPYWPGRDLAPPPNDPLLPLGMARGPGWANPKATRPVPATKAPHHPQRESSPAAKHFDDPFATIIAGLFEGGVSAHHSGFPRATMLRGLGLPGMTEAELPVKAVKTGHSVKLGTTNGSGGALSFGLEGDRAHTTAERT